jgi:secernin
MGSPGSEFSRFKAGSMLLDMHSKDKDFDVSSMMRVLRDESSGICRGCSDPFPTASSQVSVLSGPGHGMRPSCHWFTGTPDAKHSVFKPFIFCEGITLTSTIRSPTVPEAEDPARVKPRFQTKVDRRHTLFKLHEACYDRVTHPTEGASLRDLLKKVEETCVQEVEQVLDNFDPKNKASLDLGELFNDSVHAEIRFYK